MTAIPPLTWIKGWLVENMVLNHNVIPGPLNPGESTSIEIILRAVGPNSLLYPAGGLVGTHTNWAEISSASNKAGGPPVFDEDSTPDEAADNDAGGQPGSAADDVISGNGTGAIGGTDAATDEDDHDPAQITVVEAFDLAVIKYVLVDGAPANETPIVQAGDVITFEYYVENQGTQTAQDITLVDYVQPGLILTDGNWTPSNVAGPGTANRTYGGVNLASGGWFTDTVVFQVGPDVSVSRVYTNIIEIERATTPGGGIANDFDSDADNVPDNEVVIKDDVLRDNFRLNPLVFDEDDHDVALLMTIVEDWGDNPDTGVSRGTGDYGTLVADNGPRHVVIAGLRLGNLVDPEADGLPSVNADGDNNDDQSDEDGVNTADLALVENSNAVVRVMATNTGTVDAILYGFIDFNANGVFTNTGEAVTMTVPAGSNNVEFSLNFGNVPAFGISDSYARFRLSTDTNLNAQGVANDGEVEDYPVTISTVSVNPRLAVSKVYNGVGDVRTNETISFTIRITNTGDVAITVLPLEDRFNRTFLTYQSATPPPTSDVANVLTWDNLLAGDSDGLAIGESISVDVYFTTEADTSLLPVMAPCTQRGHAPNLARVRNANANGAPVVTDADDDDCDSVQILNPTAVQLAARSLRQTPDGVLVQWATVNESNIVGFYIWKSNGVDAEMRSDTMIGATSAGQTNGASYQWLDAQAKLAHGDAYVLEIVHRDGSAERTLIDVVTERQIFLPIIAR